MGWNAKSMGWIGASPAWTHKKTARTHEKISILNANMAVRFNALPNSAHAAAPRIRPSAKPRPRPPTAGGGRAYKSSERSSSRKS